MDDHRMLLTVLSVLCGLALLAAALLRTWRLHAKKRSARGAIALWGYAVLFFAAALLLWERAPSPGAPQGDEPPSERTRESDRPSASPIPEPLTVPAEQDTVRGTPKERSLETTSRQPEHAVIPVSRRSGVPAREAAGRAAGKAGAKREQVRAREGNFEERAYRYVLHVFDDIEQWFYKYGSPAARPRRDLAAAPPAGDLATVLNTPPIRFEAGSAELSMESRAHLKAVAAVLKARAEPRLLEIRARTEGNGPEPFNYILTQARAEVVRDFLVSEGVDTRRLVPVALGSEGEDSLAVGSQITFEVRP